MHDKKITTPEEALLKDYSQILNFCIDDLIGPFTTKRGLNLAN